MNERIKDAIELTGMTFGRWTVLEQSELKNKKDVWKCQCSCKDKTIRDVLGYNLRSGSSKSCGCLSREKNSKRLKKYNAATFYENYVVMYTKDNRPFYVDIEDYPRVKDMFWYMDEHGYLLCNTGNKIVLLHRFIMNATDDVIIDHEGGKTSRHDNRKSNLRVGTQTFNNMNRERQSNNKSGVTGVCWVNRDKRWLAQIKIYGKRKYLGEYKNIDDAIAARKKAEEELFGEWSYDNSQKSYQPPMEEYVDE